MYTIQANLEVSQTILAVAACLYFLGAPLKQVETRKRDTAPFIWLLLAILLISLAQAAVMIVYVDGLPNIHPMAGTILYILGLLLQIDYLCSPNEEKLAWHAVLGSWIIMAVFDLLSIVGFANVSRYVILRFCLVVVLFILFARPNREDHVRLTDNNSENGTAVRSDRTGGRGERLRLYSGSVQNQIRAAGGTWPWVKKFRIFLPWIWPSGKPWMMACVVVAQLLQQVEIAIDVYTPYAGGVFFETVLRVHTDGNVFPNWTALSVLLGLRLAAKCVAHIRELLQLDFDQFREMQVAKSTHEHLMDHDAAFHDKTNPLELLEASNSGSKIRKALDFLLETIPKITKFIVGTIASFSLCGPHAFLNLFTFTVIYTLGLFWSNRILMPKYDERVLAWKRTKQQRENAIRNYRTVVINGQISREIEAHASSLHAYMNAEWILLFLRIASEFCLSLILDLAEFSTMILVILHVNRTGGTVGAVVAFRDYWSLLQSPLLFFIHIPENIMCHLYDADRLRQIMEVKSRMEYGSQNLHSVEGRIDFQDVTFSYTSSDKAVFKNLNLTIEPGTTTGFVGPSGVGKTSLLDLILRHYDPQKGSIRIDGQDVTTLRKGMYVDNDRNVKSNTRTDVSKPGSLSDHIAVMPQSPHLFNTTVGDNIKYGHPDATAAEIQRAAERAGIHSTITSLADGYDAMVSEGGKYVFS